MSYGVAAALQEAVYQRLLADPVLTGLVGTDIFDAAPPGTVPTTYVVIGPEEAHERGDGTGRGAVHEFTVSVVTSAAGFLSAKEVAAAVSDALSGADLVLARGRLVYLNFLHATARRVQGADIRRIDLRFAARVED